MPRGNERSSCFIVRPILLGIWVVLLGLCPAHSLVADEGSVEPAPRKEAQAEARIYFLLDPDAVDIVVDTKGHAGLLVFDGTRYYYYSYSGTGLLKKSFSKWDSTVIYLKSVDPNHYQYEADWGITAVQAARARNVAACYEWKIYNALARNCWHMVYDAIRSAVGKERIEKTSSPSPDTNFWHNNNKADHWTVL